MNITVVIPALNEEQGIKKTIDSIPVRKLAGMGYTSQVLVVDGQSTDMTVALAKGSGAQVITESRLGYGRAYLTGFEGAAGEIIATADADGTYPVEDLPRLVKIFKDYNLDFLTTTRFPLSEKKAMALRNQIGNIILSWEVKVLYGIGLNDPESGMWLFRKALLDKLKLNSGGHEFSHEFKIEACYFSKCAWQEVPIQYRPRAGIAKLPTGWRGGFENLLDIAKKRIIR